MARIELPAEMHESNRVAELEWDSRARWWQEASSVYVVVVALKVSLIWVSNSRIAELSCC
jgi:hypothetical protein